MNDVRIACAGAWHSHAKDFANRLENIPYGKLVAVWDSDPEKAHEWAAEKQVRCFTDYDSLVHDPDIDGIIVTCPTVQHTDLITRAAQAGKHVYVEKALCATAADANALRGTIHDAEKKYGISFVMSEPVEKGVHLYAKQLIAEGRFGHILSIRSRSGHDLAYRNPPEVDGYMRLEQNGGGVLLDMAHHAVHTLYFLLGKPETAFGMFENVSPVSIETGAEDFVHAAFRYADGTIGIAEGGLVMPRYENGFEILGDKGWLISDADGIRCRFGDNEAFTVPENALPEAWPKAQNYWIKCIHDGVPTTLYGIDEAADLIEMVEAVYRSKGSAVSV